MESKLNRRKFLGLLGLAGAGVGLAACNQATPAPASGAPADNMNMTPGAVPAQQGGDMDAMHKAGVDAFVKNAEANSKTFWPARLPFTMDGDVKVFSLTCQELKWETEPGKTVDALAYNGVIPGPEIRVTEGDKVRVIVKNQMRESTSIHWHGVEVPNSMDGVPFLTQDPIKSGQTFTYEFVAKPFGSHMYHSHHNSTDQVTRGLLGSFVVEPKDKSVDPHYDSDYTMILNDTGVGLTLNGKGFPNTAPIFARVGEKVRIRYMNEGLMIHPMHTHGLTMTVFAQDGRPLTQPFQCDTLNVPPGNRFDVIVDCAYAGAWALHCHILSHAESPRGMFGMVGAIIVK